MLGLALIRASPERGGSGALNFVTKKNSPQNPRTIFFGQNWTPTFFAQLVLKLVKNAG